MAEPRRSLAAASDLELERALADLGRRLAYPDTPDLAGRVRARLETELPRRPSLISPVSSRGTRDLVTTAHPFLSARDSLRTLGTTRWRRAALVAACLLIAIAGALLLFPEARTTIADRLGLPGLVIRWVDETPTPAPSPIGARLMLGRPVTREEAQAAVDFPVLVPAASGFDAPGEIYLLGEGDGAMVSFVYPAAPGLPASDQTGVGALLTQFQGEPDRGLIEKGLVGKNVDPETLLESVTINGEPGFWISGAPHGVFFVCFDVGECREERYRLASDVLVWEQAGLTLRLESALSREEAIAVAESVRAPD